MRESSMSLSDPAWTTSRHWKCTIRLAAEMIADKYVVTKYLDDEEGVPFSPGLLDAFVRDGIVKGDMHVKPAGSTIGWHLDARRPGQAVCVPDDPWFYSHCHLRYYGDQQLSSRDFEEVLSEWRRVRSSFGVHFHDAGNRLMRISERVHAAPKRYDQLPYVTIRATDAEDYLEFLAFSDGYWMHVFLTDRRAPSDEAIITISFTPSHGDDQHRTPIPAEDLLLSPAFLDVR
jgi:hypothetical protein